MREIYCKTGKTTTYIPDKAWGSSVNIKSCEGCRHSTHLRHLQMLKQTPNAASTNLHKVEVTWDERFGIPYNVEVICSCLCRVENQT